MRVRGPGRLSRPIPLTPLVDVVFMLLMFFMLSTTFAKYGQLGMGQNGKQATSQAAGAPMVFGMPGVIVDVFQGPEVRVNGRPVTLNGLVAALNDFRQRGVTSGVLRAHQEASVQDLVSVLELARKSTLPVLSLSSR